MIGSSVNVGYRRIVLLHRFYRVTKFYSFLKGIAFRGGVSILIFIVVILALELFFIDISSILSSIIENYSSEAIFMIFLISETILGLLPPELFIAWGAKNADPWLFLFILATISYMGGIISYFIGSRIFYMPSVKAHLEIKLASHITKLRKWGGPLVFVGAMLPIPHSVVSMASGLIQYNFKHYLLWALFRYVRFLLYGMVIFRIIPDIPVLPL